MEDAYKLASQHSDERAGEPAFDLYYGIAAVETGRVDEAIFAFERVLLKRPSQDRARIELARAYFIQEEDLKAREQFEIVLSHDPPPSVVDRIERYLAALDRRADRFEPNVSGHVELAGGSDDNVNRAGDETVTRDFAGQRFVLADTEPESDAFAQAEGAVNVSWPLRPGLNVIGGIDTSVRGHDDRTEFDRKRGNARVGLRYRTDRHRWTTTLQGGRLYVGSDPYAGSVSLDAGYRYSVDERTGAHATFSVTRLRYDEQEQRDSDLLWAGGGMSKRWAGSWNPRARFTLLGGREAAERDTAAARSRAERDMGRVRGRMSVDPMTDWTLRASVDTTVSRYDEPGVVDPSSAREEETYSLDLALDWRPATNWELGPFLRYSQRDSNVDFYEFERSVAGVRLRYEFY
jgi:tetratricopeptide (TPR) repeat protein